MMMMRWHELSCGLNEMIGSRDSLAGVLSIKSVSANFTNVQETQKTDLHCSYIL